MIMSRDEAEELRWRSLVRAVALDILCRCGSRSETSPTSSGWRSGNGSGLGKVCGPDES